jgi:hypothetical protein
MTRVYRHSPERDFRRTRGKYKTCVCIFPSIKKGRGMNMIEV